MPSGQIQVYAPWLAVKKRVYPRITVDSNRKQQEMCQLNGKTRKPGWNQQDLLIQHAEGKTDSKDYSLHHKQIKMKGMLHIVCFSSSLSSLSTVPMSI